jgi:hypothetical protein
VSRWTGTRSGEQRLRWRGRDPRLVARSYPSEVTLVWVNPDTNCNAETLRRPVVRITLAEPLGDRLLVQSSGGGRIPYFDQRDLARVTVLPAGAGG